MGGRDVVCLMGPTASGKTDVAIRLAGEFDFDLISVDSALVYRGMDIGTAKPDPETLAGFPHALVDIREPTEPYSAGDFVRDAREEINRSHALDRTPLLVGGTMMYFRALIDGIADLPEANEGIRADIDAEAARSGWPHLHHLLAGIDPDSAARIKENDGQRIQRALEVYRVSGRTLTDWHAETTRGDHYRYVKTALVPEPRTALHERMARRLDAMFDAGFVDEVARLRRLPGLTSAHPSMRAVGYRQVWEHLEGAFDIAEARTRALAATRQLAKRQLTWLRSERGLLVVNSLENDAKAAISAHLRQQAVGAKN